MLARPLAYQALAAARTGKWVVALNALGNQLRLAQCIGARAEAGVVSRMQVLDAFAITLKTVVPMAGSPAGALRSSLEPLLGDLQRDLRFDLEFEVESMVVSILESDKPAASKVLVVDAASRVLSAIDERERMGSNTSDLRFLGDHEGNPIVTVLLSMRRTEREMVATARVIRVGLAVLAYREEKGQWPTKLTSVERGPEIDQEDTVEYRIVDGRARISVAAGGTTVSWEIKHGE
jgi:hypothetical protein